VSDLEALATDLTSAPRRVAREVKQVVSKGSLNVKNQLIQEASGSAHFGQVARSIGYDLTVTDAYVEGEIGPQKERDMSAGLLGAYWGWSKGGGGTLPDPIGALQAEEPKVAEALERLAEVILG
jgi:hypothetical protein